MRRKAKKPDTPRIWVRIDRAHVAKVIKARRMMCIGEEVKAGRLPVPIMPMNKPTLWARLTGRS